MAQHVFTFGSTVKLHLGIVGNGGGLVTFLNLHHAASQRVQVPVLVHLQQSASTLAQQLGFVLAQVHLPEVGLSFKGREVVEAFSVLAHNGVAQAAAVRCQSDNAVLQALKFYDQRFDRVGISLLVLFFVFLLAFSVLLLIVFLFIFLLQLLQQRIVFWRQPVAVVCVLCKEGEEHIVLAAPRGMTAHTIAFAHEQDSLTIHHPTGFSTRVGTLRNGMNLTAFSTDNALVGIWVAAVGNVTQNEPLAVRAPLVVESSVLPIPLAPVSNLSHLLGLQVHHLQFDAVLNKCQFLAVWTEFRVLSFHL